MRSHADDRINIRKYRTGSFLSAASVSSLVHVCGAKYSIPGSNLAPPLAQDSNRMSGNLSGQSCIQLIYTKDIFMHQFALLRTDAPLLKGSDM